MSARAARLAARARDAGHRCGARDLGSGRPAATSFYFPPLTEILRGASPTSGSSNGSAATCVPSLLRMRRRVRDRGRRRRRRSGSRSGSRAGARPRPTPLIEFLRAIPPPALLPVRDPGDRRRQLDEGVHHRVRLHLADPAQHDRRGPGVDPTQLRDGARLPDRAAATAVRHVILPAAAPQIFAGHADQPVARADHDGRQRDGRQHERDRLLRAPVAAHLRDPGDVVGHPRCSGCSATASTLSSPLRRATPPALARAARRPSAPAVRATPKPRSMPMLEVDHLRKALRRPARTPSTAIARPRPSRSPRASSSASSGPRAAARRRCCGALVRAARRRPPARSRCEGTADHGPPERMALVFQDYSRSLFPWMTRAPQRRLPARAHAGCRRRARPAAGSSRRSRRSASTASPTATRGSSPAACSSGSRSRGRSPTSRRSCSWTSRSPRSTPRPGPTWRT